MPDSRRGGLLWLTRDLSTRAKTSRLGPREAGLPSGIGDWAIALRSPSGRLAARVSPSDPAHPAFLDLCRRCAGNAHLPSVALAVDLDGGGVLTVMDFITPVSEAAAAEVAREWRAGDGDADMLAVRREALVIDARHRASVPWWDGIDLNEANVRQSVDGRLVLIDLFCLDGAALYGQILKDAAVVRQQYPARKGRHLLQIPYIARARSPDELHALQRAWGTGEVR